MHIIWRSKKLINSRLRFETYQCTPRRVANNYTSVESMVQEGNEWHYLQLCQRVPSVSDDKGQE